MQYRTVKAINQWGS